MAYDPIIYGGSKSSVKGYAASRSKYFDELEKERKKKDKDTIAFGGSDPNSKAAKVEQSKGFWGGVGDFFQGLGAGVVKGAEGVIGSGARAVDSLFVGDGENAVTKWADKAQKDTDKWTKEHADSAAGSVGNFIGNLPGGIVSGVTDAGSTVVRGIEAVPEGIAANIAASSSDPYLRKEGIKGQSDLAKRISGGKTDDITKAGMEAVLADAETIVNIITAGKGGALFDGAKASITNLGKKGAFDAIKQAAKDSGKEVSDSAIKNFIKTSAKSGTENVVLNTPIQVAQQVNDTGKTSAGDVAMDVVTNAAFGVAGGRTGRSELNAKAGSKAAGAASDGISATDAELDAVIKSIDVDKAKSADEAAYLASRKAEFEEIMANRQAGLNDDGSRIINLDDVNSQIADMQAGRYSDDLYDITTTDGKAADPELIQAATEKQVAALTARRDEIAAQVDAIESPAAREMAMANVNKLDDQIAAITSGDTKALMDTGDTGLSRTLNTERVRERFRQLQDDLAEGNFRQRAAMSEAEKRTAPSRTFDSVSDDMDALGAGGVSPEAVTPRADFTDVDEVVRHPKLPEPLKRRAMSLARDRNELQKQLDTVMTPEKANQALDEMDAKYNDDLARIDTMPEPRRSAELERIDSEYSSAYYEIQAQLAADRDVVNELTRVEEQINANMDEVLADSNIIKDNNPHEFGTVNEELNAKISQEIEAETETAIFNRMSNEEGAPDAENISKAFAEIPEGATPEVLDNSPAANDLAQEALTDLWVNDEANLLEQNLQGVSRSSLGLGLSSPSHNIRRMFGEVGRLVNGAILEGFHKTNLASKHDAALFTKIQKAFGGDRAVYRAAVDIVEGKLDVDAAGFTKQQLDGLEMFQGFWEKSKRMVQKAAAQEVMADFDARSYNGDFKYKTEEIKSLARRDGITIAEATKKYSGNTGFKKSDVIYLANQASEGATRQNYFAHMLDEELVSKNVKQEFRDSVAERQASGEFKYTDDELAILASRDGTGVEAARAKYGERGFNKRDAKYVERIMAHDAVTRAKKDFGGDAVTANIKFGNMMQRLTDSDNYSRDIIDVMARYSAGLNKKVYLEPALRKLDNAKLVLEKSKIDTKVAKDWINTYEKQLKINGISKTGEAFNEAVDALISKVKPDSPMIGNNHYRSSLAAQRLINTFGMLGFSFRNGLQQTSQIVTAVSKLGWENVAPGMIEHVKNMSNPKTRAAYRESLERASVINAGFVDDAFTDLIGTTRAKAVQNTGEFLSKYLMFMSRVTDEFVRGTTYQAALREGLSSKLPMGTAQTRAAAMAAELNFLTTKADMPTKLNGDGIRSLAQFLTFSYKQAEAWKDIGIDSVKDPVTGAFKFKPKELQRLLQGVVTAGVAFQMMESVAGIDTEDNIPFLGNFTDGSLPMSPLMALTIGQQNQPGIPQLLNDIANPDGADDYEKEQNRQDSIEKFRDMLIRSFVPAGSQIKKSVDGYNSTQNDGVVSKDGRVRFIQNAKPDDMLRNPVLFGQYATDDGKEWVDKKFPTLSEKQSEILQAQKSKEAKQRAYDFYSGLKPVGTKSNVTPKIKDIMKTQPAKAERLIRDHNAKVQEAVQAYTSKYGELSDYEKDYLMKNYYITIGNVKNLSEEDK